MEVEFLAVSAEEAVNIHRLFGFWGLSVESTLGAYLLFAGWMRGWERIES